MKQAKIRVVLADDHNVFREGVSSLLKKEEIFDVVGEAADGLETLELLENIEADVLLLDIDMPNLTGMEVMPILKERFPDLKVLVFSMHADDHYIRKMLKNGAKGYILKTVTKPELIRAIKTAAAGDSYLSSEASQRLIDSLNNNGNNHKRRGIPLTRREIDVLKLVAQGMTNVQIGDELHISHRTVDTHRRNIMEKLDLHNAAALAHYALKKGLLD